MSARVTSVLALFNKNLVPIYTPLAPSAKAAFKPLLSLIPPAASTGIEIESTIAGTILNVPIYWLGIIPPSS